MSSLITGNDSQGSMKQLQVLKTLHNVNLNYFHQKKLRCHFPYPPCECISLPLHLRIGLIKYDPMG